MTSKSPLIFHYLSFAYQRDKIYPCLYVHTLSYPPSIIFPICINDFIGVFMKNYSGPKIFPKGLCPRIHGWVSFILVEEFMQKATSKRYDFFIYTLFVRMMNDYFCPSCWMSSWRFVFLGYLILDVGTIGGTPEVCPFLSSIRQLSSKCSNFTCLPTSNILIFPSSPWTLRIVSFHSSLPIYPQGGQGRLDLILWCLC